MKKLLLVLALAATMSVPTFAAGNSATNDGTVPTLIAVNGIYKAADAPADVFSVDIVWDDMSFTYTAPSKDKWNPKTHKYENATAGSWAWDNETTGKPTPAITFTNHSNVDVEASVDFITDINGLNYSFTKDTLMLATAEGTDHDNAPKSETFFSVSGSAIDANKSLGSITVTVKKDATQHVSTVEQLLETADKVGTFTLVNNINLPDGYALKIISSDYTLNLNEFTVSGSVDEDGLIQIVTDDNEAGLKATIKNGTVENKNRNFSQAVRAKYSNVTQMHTEWRQWTCYGKSYSMCK